MSLRVLEPGLQTLVVDFGRPGSRSLGVPVGGAADRWSFTLANALVGNPPGAAALEICLAGPTLQAGCLPKFRAWRSASSPRAARRPGCRRGR